METTRQRQMRVLSKTKQIVNLLDCGATFEQAVYEVIPNFSDRTEFLFILKNFDPSSNVDKLLENVKNRKDMPSAGIYFW